MKVGTMRVVICPIMKEGAALVVTGNDVLKGVVEFQPSVQAKAETFKSST